MSLDLRHAVAFDDVFTGRGGLAFDEGDAQVRAGWLHSGGDGLIVTARVDEGVVGVVRFWCDAQQWADWLAPHLPVPSWDALPREWRAVAAALTLSTGDRAPDVGGDVTVGDVDGVDIDAAVGAARAVGGSTRKSAWPEVTGIERGTLTTLWRIGIVMMRDGRRLALAFLDGATSWLRERCREAESRNDPLDPRGLPARDCVLAAGWTTLHAAQCDALLPGDAILLDVAADVANGEYWLVDGESAVPMRDAQPCGAHVTRLAASDAVTVQAVIAQRPLPIPWLDACRAGGDIPSALSPFAADVQALCATRITLHRDTVPWAGGRLLRFGDGRVAVQIDALVGGDIPRAPEASATGDISSPDAISGRHPMGVHPGAT
ncbi:hypothetical protein [Pandoraea pnomenusa]|uniref:hypothetical protein n=1 Tax=Pandoraea pnomenusa TaxID=93220 RepID=UPI0033420A0E